MYVRPHVATCPYLGCAWSYRSPLLHLVEQSREVHMILCGVRRLGPVPLLKQPFRPATMDSATT